MTSAAAAVRGFGPVFILLFGLQFVSIGAMEMSNPFWPIYIKALSPSEAVFSLAGIGVYVCPMLGMSLTSALWGRMGDRYGNRLMMVRALVGLSVTQFLVAFAPDVWWILALRFLQGACAGYIAPAQAYAVQVTGGKDRTKLFAWLQIATNVGSLGGAVIGGIILDSSSFPVINLAAGMICAICAVIAWLRLPVPQITETPGNQINTKASEAGLASRHVSIASLLILLSIMLASRMVLQVPFSLYMAHTFGVHHWITGLSYGLMALGFVVAAPLWAVLFRDGPQSYVIGWNAAISVTCAFITYMSGEVSSVMAFAILYLAWGAILGGTTPSILSMISSSVPSDQQGSAMGVAQAFQKVASIFGIIAGVIVTNYFGLNYVFPLVSTLYALSAIYATVLWWTSRIEVKEKSAFYPRASNQRMERCSEGE